MAIAPIALGVQSNPAQDGAMGAARLINCYVENLGEEGKIKLPIRAAEGFAVFGTGSGVAGVKAFLPLTSSDAYFFSNQRVFRVTSDGVITELATMAAGVNARVTMARNRKDLTPQIAIVSTDGLVRFLENNIVTTATLPNDVPAGAIFNSVCSIDGYFVFTLNNGEFYISDIDSTTIDPLNFASCESSPDGLLRGVTRGRDVVFFGPTSTEFWQNTGNSDFPFERTTVTSVGCWADGTISEITAQIGETPLDSVIFAATDAEGSFIGVHMLDGYGSRKISTHAVDRSIIAQGTTDTARAGLSGYTWAAGGHTFYAISGTAFTWVYDTTTGLWHERISNGASRWRCNQTMVFAGKTIAGDFSNNLLYEIADSYTASGSSNLLVSASDTNGDSYSTARTVAIGGASDRSKRFKFMRWGQSREDGKVLKIEITNAVRENGLGATMTVIPPHVHAWPNPIRMHGLFVDVVPGSSQTSRPKAITGLAADVEAVKG